MPRLLHAVAPRAFLSPTAPLSPAVYAQIAYNIWIYALHRYSPTNFHRREPTICDSSPTVLLSFLSEILNSPSSIPVTLASPKSLYTPREVPHRLCSMKQRFMAASCSFTARDN